MAYSAATLRLFIHCAVSSNDLPKRSRSWSISSSLMISGGQKAMVSPRLRTIRPLAWQRSKRSEEHTSELQSRENLVCRLLLEKKKKTHGWAAQTAAQHAT